MKSRKYLWIGYKNNKFLFWSIDWLIIESINDIIKGSVSTTHPLNMIKCWSLDKKYNLLMVIL